jgi:hypothetical protein
MLRTSVALVIGLASLAVGCLGPASSEAGEESEVRAERELDVALSGHAIDPGELVGTFDLMPGEGPPPEHGRFVFLRDGTALACAAGTADERAACRPIEAPVSATPGTLAAVRRPFELHEVPDSRARYVLFRTSATDPTPFRVYAVERLASSASSDGWTFREVTRSGTGPSAAMRRLPCSETMYEEADAEHACAFYRCRLDTPPFASQRCSYLSDFGLPYCKKYFAVDFHDRRFGPRVRQCLQEAIRDRMEMLTCADLQSAAIRSHVDCYVRSGFCSLSLLDRLRIAREIEPKDLDRDIGRTLLEVEKSCAAAPKSGP